MDEKTIVEKIAEKIQPQLKTIDPDLTATAEKRRIDPLIGEDYSAWMLLFKCRDIIFSMDPTEDIHAIRRAFQKELEKNV